MRKNDFYLNTKKALATVAALACGAGILMNVTADNDNRDRNDMPDGQKPDFYGMDKNWHNGINHIRFANEQFINMLKDTIKNTIGQKDVHPFERIDLSSYVGYSIADALSSMGLDSSFEYRKKLAEYYGIKNYVGSLEQNALLLQILKTNDKTTKEELINKVEDLNNGSLTEIPNIINNDSKKENNDDGLKNQPNQGSNGNNQNAGHGNNGGNGTNNGINQGENGNNPTKPEDNEPNKPVEPNKPGEDEPNKPVDPKPGEDEPNIPVDPKPGEDEPNKPVDPKPDKPHRPNGGGSSHTHDHKEVSVTLEPNADGKTHNRITKKVCSSCGDVILTTVKEDCPFDELKTVNDEVEFWYCGCGNYIEINHKYVIISTDDVYEYKRCSNVGCGCEFKEEHKYGEGVLDPVTGDTSYTCQHEDCKHVKVVKAEQCDHDYEIVDVDDEYEYQVCSKCGDEKLVKHPYEIINKDDEYEYKKCPTCGHEIKVEHEFGEGVLDSETGNMVYTCQHKDCNHVKIINPELCDHKFEIVDYDDENEIHRCSVCGKTKTVPHVLKTVVNPDTSETTTCENEGCEYHKKHTHTLGEAKTRHPKNSKDVCSITEANCTECGKTIVLGTTEHEPEIIEEGTRKDKVKCSVSNCGYEYTVEKTKKSAPTLPQPTEEVGPVEETNVVDSTQNVTPTVETTNEPEFLAPSEEVNGLEETVVPDAEVNHEPEVNPDYDYANWKQYVNEEDTYEEEIVDVLTVNETDYTVTIEGVDKTASLARVRRPQRFKR